MSYIISGIQQVGIGIPEVYEAFKFYRHNFGADVPVFDEAATAALMLPYTAGKPHDRHAILALNLQGGGGFEIWQYTSRTPQPANFEIQLGDYGIFATKIKCKDARAVFNAYQKKDLNIAGLVHEDPAGKPTFYLTDPYDNFFQLVESTDWFNDKNELTGGVYGCTIGVSNMDKSKKFYTRVLGYDEVVYDTEGNFEDLRTLPGGTGMVRRCLLRHSMPRKGAFSKMLGSTEIELVQSLERTPKQMFENRLWGDLGFIHLCFDVARMDDLKIHCQEHGHPFTVDSGDFQMGEASGRFAYAEDPDGTLIEFVEAYKIPLLKKIGWYKSLQKRDPEKPLPDWMLKAMKFNRVKD